MKSHSFKFYFHLNFCYENMHVHVSLSYDITFDIKISGWTKAIKSTEMNLETFQFYYFTSILSEKKGKE